MSTHVVRVGPLPAWVPAHKLLGAGAWTASPLETGTALEWTTSLARDEAADVATRLRKLTLDGLEVRVEVTPALGRGAVRAARTREAQRRRESSGGFVRRDVRLDPQGRWSLTPEPLAMRMAERAGQRRILDAGCGAGGNAIAFAREGCSVVAVDVDAARLADAEHNASVYGVSDRIAFHVGDALEFIARGDASILFVDPPWGMQGETSLRRPDDHPLVRAALSARSSFEEVWLKLPPAFAFNDLVGAELEPMFGVGRGDARTIKFVWVRLNGG